MPTQQSQDRIIYNDDNMKLEYKLKERAYAQLEEQHLRQVIEDLRKGNMQR